MVKRHWLVAGAATAVVLAAATTAGALVSGGDGASTQTAASTSRPLTEDEATRLAVMRFDNYRAGGSHFRADVPTAKGLVHVDGLIDHRRHVGLGQVSGLGASFTFQWDKTRLAAWPGATGALTVPEKLPTGDPVVRSLDPRATAIDSVFAFVLALGNDRPDNVQLLQQNGAQWLGRETVDGQQLDVMTGPSTEAGSGSLVHYLVATDGRLGAVDAYLGGAATPTRILLDHTGYRAFDVAQVLGEDSPPSK